MEIFLIVVGIIVSIIADFIIALEFGNIAEKKGFNKNKYFAYSFLLPFAGWLMVVALPDSTACSETNNYLNYILRNGVNVYICEDDDEDAEELK